MCVNNENQLPGCCEWLWSVIIVARRTDKISRVCLLCYGLAQLSSKLVESLASSCERAGLSHPCVLSAARNRACEQRVCLQIGVLNSYSDQWKKGTHISLIAFEGILLLDLRSCRKAFPSLLPLCFLLPFSKSRQVYCDVSNMPCLSSDSPKLLCAAKF